MTYCLALRLDEGLVFLADTRTNAGVDNVGTFRKLHVIQPLPDRLFVIESAGSLATTHQVLGIIHRDLDRENAESLATVRHLFEAALYLGRLGREVTPQHEAALGVSATATFILGGEIAGDRPDLFLGLPGRHLHPRSDERPFLQIGENKYGKFLLELGVKAQVDLTSAMKIAISSMVTTAGANLSVGSPYHLGIYRNGSLQLEELRVDADSPLLERLQDVWHRHLLAAIEELPEVSQGDLSPEVWTST